MTTSLLKCDRDFVDSWRFGKRRVEKRAGFGSLIVEPLEARRVLSAVALVEETVPMEAVVPTEVPFAEMSVAIDGYLVQATDESTYGATEWQWRVERDRDSFVVAASTEQHPTFDLSAYGPTEFNIYLVASNALGSSGEAVDSFQPETVLMGDANGNGRVDATDLNIVGQNWLGVGNWSDGDFTGDGIVDAADLNVLGANWLSEVTTPIPGDATGDGRVDATDLNVVGVYWDGTGDWSQGDFTGDGVVDAADLNVLGMNWHYGVDPPGDANGDCRVDTADLNIVGMNWQESGKTLSEGDFTDDGLVDVADLNVLASNWNFGEDMGDANRDGRVDALDLNVVALNWHASDRAWAEGDFTGDGYVDVADLNALALNWQPGL